MIQRIPTSRTTLVKIKEEMEKLIKQTSENSQTTEEEQEEKSRQQAREIIRNNQNQLAEEYVPSDRKKNLVINNKDLITNINTPVFKGSYKDMEVAVKRIDLAKLYEKENKKRSDREIAIQQILKHVNVLAIYDVQQDKNFR